MPDGWDARQEGAFTSILKGSKVDQADLAGNLRRGVDKWSANSYDALGKELKQGPYGVAIEGEECDLQAELPENREDRIHVLESVCGDLASLSCFLPLRTSFLVCRDGRVNKQLEVAGNEHKAKLSSTQRTVKRGLTDAGRTNGTWQSH